MSLNIPIFNKLEGIYSVRRAKLEIQQQQLQVETVKDVLKQEVKKAQLNVKTAFNRYI